MLDRESIIFSDSGHKIIHYLALFGLFIILILQILAPQRSYSETIPPAPFSIITIRVNGAINSNNTIFHQYWNPEFGGELIFEMPFYAGNIQAGLHLFPYSGKSDFQPDFLSLYFFIGWGLRIQLISELFWTNTLRIGSYQMNFEDSGIHESQALESELGIGVFTEAGYMVSKNWSFQTSLGLIYVATNKPLRLFMITGGVSCSFDTPEWLRKLLR
jgi:hypothetical protein